MRLTPNRRKILAASLPLTISLFLLYVRSPVYPAEHKHKHQPHAHRHTQYAKMKNPVPADAQSIGKGRELYEKHCVSCHGETGKSREGSDFSAGTFIHGNSDGEIFHVISDGVKETAMKGYRKEISRDMRWNIVNYIKSLDK